jgi:hypothetical protein
METDESCGPRQTDRLHGVTVPPFPSGLTSENPGSGG